MSIFKRPFKKDQAQSSVQSGGQHTLFLYLSDIAWRMQLADETGILVGEPSSEDCALVTGEMSERMGAVQARAIKALSRADRRKIGHIRIMLSDNSTVLLDDAAREFEGAGPDALRQIAKRQLNCESATYGISELTSADGGSHLYGMVDASYLRGLLHSLEDMALGVVEITPAAATLAKWAAGLGRPYCGLMMDAYHTKVVVSGGGGSGTVVRTLPIGVMSFPAAVAHQTRVKLPKALDGLQKRDIISTLDTGTEAGEVAGRLSKGPMHDAMAPLLRALRDEIDATLRYVADQRLCPIPDRIELLGEHGKVMGLKDWLSANLSLPVETSEVDLFELFTTGNAEERMNLLAGAEGPLVTIGKIKYRYSQDGFVEDVPAPVADINISRDTSRRNRGGKDRQRRGSQRRGRQGSSDQATFFGITLPGRQGGQQGAASSEQAQRLYHLLLAVVFFGLLYWAYITYYEDALKRHRSALSNYEIAIQANNNAWRQLREHRSKSTDLALRARKDDDKVLWSEKMLAIAGHMDDKMWISDVYLVNETTTFNEQSVSARKLTIEGAVLPSTDGHILEIARYIARLTADKLFMRDFGRITFEGAAIDTQETAHIVKFALDAWYDETKVVSEAEGEGGKGPTGKLTKQVNQRTDQLEQVRDAGGRQ